MPSTSLSGWIAPCRALIERLGETGRCRMMPVTLGSTFKVYSSAPHLLDGDVGGNLLLLEGDAGLLRLSPLVPDVEVHRWVLADADRHELRRPAGLAQVCDLPRDILQDLAGDLPTVHDLCCHNRPLEDRRPSSTISVPPARGSRLDQAQASARRRDGLAGGGVRRWNNGGEGGIRTLGTVTSTTVFETAPFDHSGTSPQVEAGGRKSSSGRARGT